jgi:hypothetical protein
MRPELRAAVVYALAEAGDSNLGSALDAQWSRRKDLRAGGARHDRARHAAGAATRAPRTGCDACSHPRRCIRASWFRGRVRTFRCSTPTTTTTPRQPPTPCACWPRSIPTIRCSSGAAQWLMLAAQRRRVVGLHRADRDGALRVGRLPRRFARTRVRLYGRRAGQRPFRGHSATSLPADAMSGAIRSLSIIDAAHLQPGSEQCAGRPAQRQRPGLLVCTRAPTTPPRRRTSRPARCQAEPDSRLLRSCSRRRRTARSSTRCNRLSGTAQVGDVLAVHEAINGTPMRYLLLEDPIPAGTEFMCQRGQLSASSSGPAAGYDWFTRREFHDDHAAFFARRLQLAGRRSST